MRGKGNLSGPFYSRSGITPACAGKRVRQHRRAGGKRDHPRVCGEKKKMNMRKDRRMGSPPRVRGKDVCIVALQDCCGITPACAGKRVSAKYCVLQVGDHPRVCGEKQAERDSIVTKRGSPPRVRGKVFPSSAFCPCYRDHPRVCGEKTQVKNALEVNAGSPPRVRGKD